MQDPSLHLASILKTAKRKNWSLPSIFSSEMGMFIVPTLQGYGWDSMI